MLINVKENPMAIAFNIQKLRLFFMIRKEGVTGERMAGKTTDSKDTYVKTGVFLQ